MPSLAVSMWDHIQCSMPVEEWATCLSDHPEMAYCDYLLSVLREGFHIGYQQDQMCCQSTSANMQSAAVRPEVISSFLEAEVQAGQVLGPVGPEQYKSTGSAWSIRTTSQASGDGSLTCLSQGGTVSIAKLV